MWLEHLAWFASVVSALAIVVSAIYASMQIRHNTRAVRAAAFQQVVNSFAQISFDIALAQKRAGNSPRPFLILLEGLLRTAGASPLAYSAAGASPLAFALADLAFAFDGLGAAGTISNAGALSLMRTLTSPPLTSLPNSNSSASGCLIFSWTRRPIGRAP